MDARHKYTVAKWFAGILVVALLTSLFIPTFGRTAAVGNITKGISNCRQIIIALHLYADDHEGRYPTGETSNQVFREFFKTGILDTEWILACPLSPSQPDGNISQPPTFLNAVEAGENH